jgi:hypothetical protein
MTNVDVALLTGHDLRNDNIELMRQIGENDTVAPHPQLVKLFEHYKFMLGDTTTSRDDTLYKASIAWIYSKFYALYGENTIYRDPVNTHLAINGVFYKKYLIEVDPLLIALSFNSIAYLWFCTEEHDLVGRIIKRLVFLSSVWQGIGDDLLKGTIRVETATGAVSLESHWAKCLPSFEMVNSSARRDVDLRIGRLLPPGFVKCLSDVFTAHNLFRHDQSDYHTIPNDINWSIFIKICLNADMSVTRLIEIIKKLDSVFFDPEFMFSGLKWSCTHAELLGLLRSDQCGYNNQNLWLLLCYLNHTGQLTVDGGTPGKYTWGSSGMSLGRAMFDHFVYRDSSSIMAYLNYIQYKRNRQFDDHELKRLIALMKKYREFGLTLDPKKLKIGRGVLVNLLSVGMGDILCTS